MCRKIVSSYSCVVSRREDWQAAVVCGRRGVGQQGKSGMGKQGKSGGWYVSKKGMCNRMDTTHFVDISHPWGDDEWLG